MKHVSSAKKLAALLFLLALGSNTAWAAPRTVEDARRAAREQMGNQAARRAQAVRDGETGNMEPALVFTKSKSKTKPDEAYYYVFSAGNDHGYTIVSGDDRLPAIVGYTESGDYDADHLPVNFVSFMQAYEEFMDKATDQEIEEVVARRANRTARTTVAPLMESKWNQDEPYNNLCPEYKYYSDSIVNTDRTVTGCVATAIAQILYYHRYPAQLKETIPAYTATPFTFNGYLNELQLAEVEAGETYDWDKMLPRYSSSATEEEQAAVAKLMLHAGCAVQASYGPKTGASATAETFTRYFGMDLELTRRVSRADYQLDEWDDMLYDELAARRPVYYDGQSIDGGHAFVIHGYSDGLYLINWGWGGMADGYFDVTLLNPHNTFGAGASSSADGYSMQNSMIIGIQPDNGVVDDVPGATLESYTTLALSVSSIYDSVISGKAEAQVLNRTMTNTTFVGIGYKNEEGHIVNIVPSPYRFDGSDDLNTNYIRKITLSYTFGYEEGKGYNLMLIESRDGSEWTACKNAMATACGVRVADGQATTYPVKPELSASVTLDENSGGYAKMSNTIAVSVRNAGEKEYYDKVYVLVNNTPTRPNGYTYAQGITAPANDTATCHFEYAPNAAGTYYFWVLDVNQNEIGTDSIVFTTTDAPALSFISVTCENASEDKTLARYAKDDYVEMNTVYDTNATFTFEIRNDGGFYEGMFKIYTYVGDADWPLLQTAKLTLPANETTRASFTVEGNIGEIAGLKMKSEINAISHTTNLYCYSEDGLFTGDYYPLSNGAICYLAGNDLEQGIGDVPKANHADEGEYYSLQGVKTKHPAKGIYIRNGKKYIFR